MKKNASKSTKPAVRWLFLCVLIVAWAAAGGGPEAELGAGKRLVARGRAVE